MKFLYRLLSAPPQHHKCRHQHRFFSDEASVVIKCVRDRGLDHAVAREKNLRPIVNLKDLIKSEPSKSIPISLISQQKQSLRIPIRPIDFVRSYPSIFQEFLPGGIGIHPHVKLTAEVLDIDSEEQLVYQTETYKQELADRLLKLLMISRINKIPLKTLDILKWDLGLPQDYAESLVPEFPDYFRVVNGAELELVCWSDELAVSALEKKVMASKEKEYSKGMPIAFPMKFSKGFEMDKKVKKWIDVWQKLPYVSPYENAVHLPPKSEESDKYTASVLHEILNLFIAKKSEKDILFYFGEYLGLRSRIKRVLLHHPGIFYLSSKIETYTVVLRESYKRGLLIESNPLMNVRSQYIHLMNKGKEEQKTVSTPVGTKQEKETVKIEDSDNDDSSQEEEDAESDDVPGSLAKNVDVDDEGQGEKEYKRGVRETVTATRKRDNRRKNSLGSVAKNVDVDDDCQGEKRYKRGVRETATGTIKRNNRSKNLNGFEAKNVDADDGGQGEKQYKRGVRENATVTRKSDNRRKILNGSQTKDNNRVDDDDSEGEKHSKRVVRKNGFADKGRDNRKQGSYSKKPRENVDGENQTTKRWGKTSGQRSRTTPFKGKLMTEKRT